MVSDPILVTGAKGQLGTELVAYLGRTKVVVGCDLEDFDITDRDAVRQAFGKIRPGIVLHAAAFTDVDRCETEPDLARAVNGDATGYIAEACRDIGARMVYYSTDYVFAGTKRTPYVESDFPNPQTVYGRSKLEGERRVAETLGESCILRLAWVYGYHGRNFVKTMIRLGVEQMQTERRGEAIVPISVVSDQIGNPSWTADIVRQTEAVLKKSLSGVYHCTAEGETSWYDLAVHIFSNLRLPVEVRACTTAQYSRPAPRPAYSSLENAGLKAAGCNVMRDWREGLGEFLAARKEELLHAV